MLDRVRATRPDRASILEHAVVVEINAARLVLGFEASQAFLAAQANEPLALESLTQAARAHFGGPTEITIESAVKAATGTKTIAAINADRREAEQVRARAAVEGHPLVKEAVRLFDARIRDVKLPATEG